MKNLYPTFILLLTFLLFGCTQQADDADSDADIAEIMALYDNYFEGVSTDDLDLFMTVWAEDGIRSEPGMPEIVGKENIRERFGELMMSFDHSVRTIGEIKVETDNNLAFGYCTVQIRSVPKQGGEGVLQEVKALSVFKKQPDGFWKFQFDCVNMQPPWSADSIPDALREVNPYY